MAEPLKNLLDGAVVAHLRHHLRRTWPGFDGARFEALARAGLDDLELKARAAHLCAALVALLPDDFSAAADIVEASLAPARGDEDLADLKPGDTGLAGWAVWPLADFVARAGLDHPERALRCLHALTQRFTAEWAIRPFIVTHPEATFAALAGWANDPSPHVRRLVSEGSRPRLPWGIQLKGLIADPAPTLPLLERLQDDPSPYVRRSVANHLNDIAKDHPALVADWLARHLPGASAERRALLKHASRTLIKRGDAPVLKAWGLGARFAGRVELALSPHRVVVGETLALRVVLVSTARRTQKLAIDYAVHHVGADGQARPKVFKGWVIDLAPGERRELAKRHSMRPITTRRYHPGRHAVELRINGQVVAAGFFDLRA